MQIFFLYRNSLVKYKNTNKIFILTNFITANRSYAQHKNNTPIFIEKLNETTNTCKGITTYQEKVLKVYALVRYLKLVKKNS